MMLDSTTRIRARAVLVPVLAGTLALQAVSYTHLTLPTTWAFVTMSPWRS